MLKLAHSYQTSYYEYISYVEKLNRDVEDTEKIPNELLEMKTPKHKKKKTHQMGLMADQAFQKTRLVNLKAQQHKQTKMKHKKKREL